MRTTYLLIHIPYITSYIPSFFDNRSIPVSWLINLSIWNISAEAKHPLSPSASQREAELTLLCSSSTEFATVGTTIQHNRLCFTSMAAVVGTHRLTCWDSSTTVTYSTMFPPLSDTTTEVITHSYQNKSTWGQDGEGRSVRMCTGGSVMWKPQGCPHDLVPVSL